jgi:hypothetical protein
MCWCQANPLGLLESAKQDVDFDMALEEQRRVNAEYHDRQRQLQEVEWQGLQFAQQLEQEEKDVVMAVQLQVEERKAAAAHQQQVAYAEFLDRASARNLHELEADELRVRQEEAAKLAEADAVMARNMVSLEQHKLAARAFRQKVAAEDKMRQLNWINPQVSWKQDSKLGCMHIAVCLPELGHTDLNVKPENDTLTVITIAAISANRKKVCYSDKAKMS